MSDETLVPEAPEVSEAPEAPVLSENGEAVKVAWTVLADLFNRIYPAVGSGAWQAWDKVDQIALSDLLIKLNASNGKIRATFDAPIYKGTVTGVKPVREQPKGNTPGRRAAAPKSAEDIFNEL